MKQTENYALILPDGTDKVKISDLNKNFTEIDSKIYANQYNIINLNKQVLVGGAGTLAFTVADNTQRIDDLEETVDNLETDGGGVIPALYVLEHYIETAEGITWHVERWSDGFSRCWGRFVTEAIEIKRSWYDIVIGNVYIPLPLDLFTALPIFISVTIESGGTALCAYNVHEITKSEIGLEIARVEKLNTTSTLQSIAIHIEVRGDSSVG